MKKKLIRVTLLPIGIILKLFELAKEGARDLDNKLRFKTSIIDKQCCIDSNTFIAENCHILPKSFVNNSSIGKYSYIGRNCIVQNATIGAYCSIANDSYIGLGIHPKSHFSTSPLFYKMRNPLKVKVVNMDLEFDEYQPVCIGNDVWVGARATILDGVVVGDGAIVAAGSVVTKDVPPYAIIAGVPAKIINFRFNQEKIKHLLELKWWELQTDNILSEIDKQEGL